MPSSFSLALCPSTIKHRTILLITVILRLLSIKCAIQQAMRGSEEATFTQVASIARWDLHHKINIFFSNNNVLIIVTLIFSVQIWYFLFHIYLMNQNSL